VIFGAGDGPARRVFGPREAAGMIRSGVWGRYTRCRMNSTVEPLEGNKVKLSIQVEESEFEVALDAAFKRIATEVNLPGFRKGKAPRRVLEAKLGSSVGREEALKGSLPDFYEQAIIEHEVDVIASPEIDITSGQTEGLVAFDAVVEVRPEIVISGYEAIEVTIPSPNPSDEDVDEQLTNVLGQFGELESVDRPAQDGDHVTMNIAGTQNDEEVPGLTAEEYTYELGSGAIVPELDANLTGAKPGDILDFEADHPDEDQDPLRFKIIVKDVQEKVLPELSDEFAAENTEFGTAEELRGDVVRRVSHTKLMVANQALDQKFSEALAELVLDDIPDVLIGTEVEGQVQNQVMELQRQGIDARQYLAAMGDQGLSQMMESMREPARIRVKVDLALRAIAIAESLEATDADLDEEFEKAASQIGSDAAEIRDQFERTGRLAAVRSDLKKNKAMDWLLDRANITGEDGEPIERSDLKFPAAEDEDDRVVDGPDPSAVDSTPIDGDDSASDDADEAPAEDSE